jgi:hypothetical protein
MNRLTQHLNAMKARLPSTEVPDLLLGALAETQASWQPRSGKYKELWQRWLGQKKLNDPRGRRAKECPHCSREMPGCLVSCRDCWEIALQEDERLNAIKNEGNESAAGLRPYEKEHPQITRGRGGQADLSALEVPCWEIILRAARSLPEVFSLSALVVAAWKLSPSRLGLPGMESHYPSDRRVVAMLLGSKGMVAKGLLERVEEGVGTYRVGKKGHNPGQPLKLDP